MSIYFSTKGSTLLLYVIILLNHQLIVPVHGVCFGMICTVSPFVAKACCENYNRCCLEFQEWLLPLLTIPEGPLGGQYPGPFVGGPGPDPGGYGYGGGPARLPLRRSYLYDGAQSMLTDHASTHEPITQMNGVEARMKTQSLASSGQPWPSASANPGATSQSIGTNIDGNKRSPSVKSSDSLEASNKLSLRSPTAQDN